MNILAISNHATMLGGGEHSFADLISALSVNWNILAVMPEEKELALRLKKIGVSTRIIPLPTIRPWLLHKIASSLRKYFETCRSYQPRLIYANGSRAAFYGGLVGRSLNIPVIWHCRISTKDPLLDYFLCRMSSCIVANSEATKTRFNSKILQKVHKVYNGIDLSWLQKSSLPKPALAQPDWKVILVVARASKQKRHDLAISAFEKVAASTPNCHLVCLGAQDASDKAWWHHLQDRTSKSAFSKRIHWVGEVEDVRPWYRRADVMVSTFENESFGRVVVEAMASGLPVVATRSGGIIEIIRQGKDGILVTPGHALETADAIVKILKDETFRMRLRSSAIKRAENFSLDAHVESMVKIFDDIIDGKGIYPSKNF